MLGRTTITGILVEFEDARLNFRPGVPARTGLDAGWGFGFRAGIDLWDWVALHAGVRVVSPNDSRSFSESVVTCTQQVVEDEMCDTTPHMQSSSTGGALLTLETGLQPNLHLTRALILSPALLAGYAWLPSLSRSIDQCTDCSTQTPQVNGNAPYLAGSIRLTAICFGLSFRYDRYLAGDLQDSIAVGFDLNFLSRMY